MAVQIEESNQPPITRSRSALAMRIILAGILIGVVGTVLLRTFNATPTRELLIEKTEQSLKTGEFIEAEELARELHESSPKDTVSAELLARCLTGQQKFQEAVSLIEQFPESAGLQKRSALIYRDHLLQLDKAAKCFQLALNAEPNDVQTLTDQANLLTLCGQKSDSVELILRVIQSGAETDLVMLLAREESGIDDLPTLLAAREATPEDSFPILGLAQRAILNDDPEAAIRLLREALELSNAPSITRPLLMLELSKLERDRELSIEIETARDRELSYPQYWQARGELAARQGDRSSAMHCYLKAWQLAPESRSVTSQLIQLAADADRDEGVIVLKDRLQKLDQFEQVISRVLFGGQQGGIDDLLAVTNAYYEVGRAWEALHFCKIAIDIDPNSSAFRKLYEQLQSDCRETPLRLTLISFIDPVPLTPDEFPLSPPSRDDSPQQNAPSQAVPAIAFVDQAQQTGFHFRFQNKTGADGKPLIWTFSGGGIGVIDFDLDGWPDVICTQADCRPLEPAGSSHDQLFRNLSGEQFVSVEQRALVEETGFGQGVSIGDVNSDGFPDVYIANFGKNALHINNGDGTFALSADFDSEEQWTTSCLVADLNSDGLADLYDVNYLSGTDGLSKTCLHADGSLAMCQPYDFDGAPDSIRLNTRSGMFQSIQPNVLPAMDGKGLGIVTWREEHSDGPLLFVANDTTANYLFQCSSKTDGLQLNDVALTSGVAFNRDGKAEGCMGVVVSDFDQNGLFDLHTTNFLAESNTFYQQLTPGFFEDRTVASQLESTTWNSLGFGTQSLDSDLDGTPELFVANGHLQDLTRFGRPFRMAPQLFYQAGIQFHELPGSEVGEYFQRLHLGRAAVKLDWNRDGLDDLIVGHLDEDYALLTNQTLPVGKHLKLTLKGVQSARDAIGARVRITGKESSRLVQLTAGDGYLASNERVLNIGWADLDRAVQIEIQWPSGIRQVIQDVNVPGHFLIVEEQEKIYSIGVNASQNDRPDSTITN
ncbi:FG-GAP-like repeat-containing protein [Thalassoglobus sp. JC818]|uniref:FG-GAP-like repeat-containing protein n=1 Tax=Thalassoglobus sp. JC818 TaxID=3232136 RepID=UPI00345955DB